MLYPALWKRSLDNSWVIVVSTSANTGLSGIERLVSIVFFFKGALLVRRRRPRGHVWGRPCAECSPRHEFPGVPAEEALAEREVAAYQVHHGTGAEALLSCWLDCIYLRQSCIYLAFLKHLNHEDRFESLNLFQSIHFGQRLWVGPRKPKNLQQWSGWSLLLIQGWKTRRGKRPRKKRRK